MNKHKVQTSSKRPERTASKLFKKSTEEKASKITTLPCGCKYEDYGFLLIRVYECETHKKLRTTKRPKRAKAESVRP